jgi:hypothetical protein
MRKRGIGPLGIMLLFCWLGATLGCDCLCGEKTAAVKAPPRIVVPAKPSDIEPGKPWHFAVSGDSRNCGDVVMPAIAHGADQDKAKFYWHLGDLRAIYDFDEDMLQDAKMNGQHLTIINYETKAWENFKHNQTVPFGPIPFFLGIGNHETISPKNRCEFSKAFDEFLNSRELQQQRLEDDKDPEFVKATKQCSAGTPLPECNSSDDTAGIHPKTYFHWVVDGVDFIYLDNGTKNQFDQCQMAWFNALAEKDAKSDAVRTLVVGMHEALPYSISQSHSMNESPQGEASGREVYRKLLALEGKKKVYVLASHSHYYMEDIFNTQYWKSNGGVLPGWIVGTAGAVRYALPEPNAAKVAKTNVYGYLLGTVSPAGQEAGTVQFEFKQLEEKDVPAAIVHGFSQEFVHWCFVDNTQAKAGNKATPEH